MAVGYGLLPGILVRDPLAIAPTPLVHVRTSRPCPSLKALNDR